ncbi:hypothetical protein CVT26_012018 [Gymnopilus dilepis]|uniref:F-box domain-containing protein n=1 Tax=Gymnopilus dilepis TaxID=231916 RepID=A0A409YHS6_9AGAR|nr:hypothetical protein CVT26_012018 [Gymnopilus dilepis]
MPPRATRSTARKKPEDTADEDVEVLSDNLEERDESSVEGVSEAESEYGPGTKSKSKAPPKKRAKTSRIPTENSPAKKAPRGKKSLSLLPTMPLDVLYEIFGNLSPKDIFNLAKTNKAFRQTLLSPNATTVWISARQRFGAPDPPEDMSEIAWAALLFGTSCQKCGAKNIRKVDFMLRLRVCTNCKKNHFVVESRFKTLFPDIDRSVLELIPYTNTGGWSHGYASNSRFFWDADIHSMIRKLAVFEDDVHRRRLNAAKKLADFKMERMARVTEIKDTAAEYGTWLSASEMERYKASVALVKQRKEAIVERFIELGYAEADVSGLTYRKEFQGTTQLTDRIWNRIRPLLEPEIAARKAKRLEEEFAKIQRNRRGIVDDLYKSYKASLHPSQWKYLPRTFDLCQLSPIAAMVEAPIESTVTAADFAEAAETFPALLSSFSEDRKQKARALLPSAPPAPREPGEIEDDVVQDVLDLATSVFECRNVGTQGHARSSPVVGSDDLLSHHCGAPDHGLPHRGYYYWYSSSEEGKLLFSEEGSQVAASLVRLAGLDPTTALASDMDKKDLRFSCSRCIPLNVSGSWSRRGYSWRSAILHVLDHAHSGPSQPNVQYNWAVLSVTDADAVKASEMLDRKWDRESWTCARCTTFLDNLRKRVDILDHLKSEHQIADPKQGDDFIFHERFRSSFVGSVSYSVPKPSKEQLQVMTANGAPKVHCVHCSSVSLSAKNRLFDVVGVTQHIKAKHNCPNPQMGKDFVVAKAAR